MTPQEKLQFEQMKKELETLRKAQDVNFFELFSDVLFLKRGEVTDADVTITTTVPIGGGDVDHLDFPDNWIFLRYKGKIYRIPMYLIDRP